MQKKKKQFLILGAILLSLLAIYFLLGKYNTTVAEKEAKKEAAATVYVTKISKLAKISYTNNTDTLSFVKKSGKWSSKSAKDVALTQSYFDTMVSEFGKLEATRKLSESSDELADYGLETPAYTITLTDSNGTEIKLLVGNAVNDSEYYVKRADKDTIYTVSSSLVSAMQFDLNSMVAIEDTPTLLSDSIKKVEVTKNSSTTIYEPSTAETADSSETSSTEETDPADTVFSAVSSFYLTSCINYAPSETDIQSYGLDEQNRTKVTITYKENKKNKTFTFFIGNLDETNSAYYVQLESYGIVYEGSATSLAKILDPSSSS